ncbi:MAG: DUF1932 domain-containing protein [Acidobacteria bacterium]|nr:DUF1932 domain-containing protein [Acidobacteriota bacterium]
MTIATVGLLHPGAMGVTVGVALRDQVRVVWASEGRSRETRARAAGAGLEDLGTLAALTEAADAVLSVCPPHGALALAETVAATGFDGLYLDANAVSPSTALEIAGAAAAGGARFVDGGIVGPPAVRPGTTRLYLSGDAAAELTALFEGSALEAIDLDADVGAASALKMCYAGFTKGSAALLLSLRAAASAYGVEEGLLGEWGRSQPGLEKRSVRAAATAAPKAWRFAGEMEEIASTLEAAGLPDGFHRAAAEAYVRLAGFRGEPEGVAVEEVVAALLQPADGA